MQHKKTEIIETLEEYINDYKDSTGGSTPTVREIAADVGLAYSTVSRYLTFMKEQGIVEYAGRRNIVTKQSKHDADGFCRVPILGAVSCGLPKYAEENIEEYVKLPVSMFGRGDFFILRAKGDPCCEDISSRNGASVPKSVRLLNASIPVMYSLFTAI